MLNRHGVLITFQLFLKNENTLSLMHRAWHRFFLCDFIFYYNNTSYKQNLVLEKKKQDTFGLELSEVLELYYISFPYIVKY